jgi:hypothetical protein
MENIKKLKSEFYRIKSLNYVRNTRPKNKDGGIGNTFEDLLGVEENNKKEADFEGIEIKSQRYLNKSYISLFTKSPDFPNRANTYLREKYGEVRDIRHPEKKKLYASIFGDKYSDIYSKYKMKLNVNRDLQRIELEIKDTKDNIYWEFNTLREASRKLQNLFLVLAETKKENDIDYCYFSKANIFYDFCFEKFLEQIEKGNIQFDIRIGVYNSGKNYGKTHDHGSGFRIKKEFFNNLYSSNEELE